MVQQQSTMTEFTFAPGETNVIGDRFSPSVLLFWLKTSVAASSMRVQYKSPNTILGVIPLGARTQTIPLRNIASVETNTKFNVGNFVFGLVLFIAGIACMKSSALAGILLILFGIAALSNMMSAQLDFVNNAGGRNSVIVSALEKNKLMALGQEIQQRVFADYDQMRHQESMGMMMNQYAAQANSAMIQQQMLNQMQAANQQAANQQVPAQGYQQQPTQQYPQQPTQPIQQPTQQYPQQQ